MATGALGSALSGLNIAQQQLNVISNNIANASTEGYTRKILPQSAQAINGEYVGVLPEILTRYVDTNLQRDLWTQVSVASSATIKADYLSNVEEIHGGITSQTNISSSLSNLRDSFSSLSDDPSDFFLQESVVTAAQDTAKRINGFADFLTQQRNDVIDDITETIDRTNALLEQIAGFNAQIIGSSNVGRSTAHLEDLRDSAIEELSSFMEVSYFRRGDGAIILQTARGNLLADQQAIELTYAQAPAGASSYYPGSINGIFIGDPNESPNALDITSELKVGGKLGGLLELRDDIFPEYIAQIDELAHKLALRFDEQGLRLFTDPSGLIPANTDPNTLTNTPVEYVGFASNLEVNSSILADFTLIQAGTLTTRDQPIPAGSNELVQRIIEFTFGENEYEIAEGTKDLNSVIAPPNDTVQNWLGLSSQNTLTGGVDLTAYGAVNINEASGAPYFPLGGPPPYADTFNIRLFNGVDDTGLVAIDLDAAVAAYPIGGAVTDAGEQLRLHLQDEINLAIAATSISATVSITPYGQIQIETNSNVEIDSGSMGDDGLDFLGLAAGTYNAEDPYIDIEIGNNGAQRVYIDSDDTLTDFLDKLNYNGPIDPGGGVLGLYAEVDAITGFITIRPGTDNTPSGDFTYGGGLRITGGPFTALGAADGVTTDGTPIIEAIFGVPDPVTSVAHAPYKTTNLGPNLEQSTSINTGTTLIDFAQKMINRQITDLQIVRSTVEEEKLFENTLKTEILDLSGVNVEEELAQMIVIQNAFSAAARTIGVIDELFDELFQNI